MESLKRYIFEAVVVVWLVLTASQYVVRYLILSPEQAEQIPDFGFIYILMICFIVGATLCRAVSRILKKE
jgi:regulator of sirC expression with transglutaminase-like and TPR domain